jgi:CRISPR-associated endonuclease/helicase Cas3
MGNTNFFAHTNEKGPWQPLKEHLEQTAAIAKGMGQRIGLGDYAALCGYLHDIGKYSQAFQRRLRGIGGRVDHSTAGAKLVMELDSLEISKILRSIIAFCVSGHHAGLPDYGSSIDLGSENSLCGRFKKEVEDFSAYQDELDFSAFRQIRLPALKATSKESVPYTFAFMTHMLYSILVDADFLETEAALGQGREQGDYLHPDQLLEPFNAYMKMLGTRQGNLTALRNEIYASAVHKAQEAPGFFTMTVPTGGGKTLASMGFALNHAKEHQLERIIYIIPYTSIIEQTAATFKQILGFDKVLEHHSNYSWEDIRKLGLNHADDQPNDADDATNQTIHKLKLATENWDLPIIVTTNVQFFESIYANRSSRSRKVHRMANSVLIFDEAQMIPRDFLQPCMAAVRELVHNYGSSAVFCTATQPSLQRFFPGTNFTELASQPKQLYQDLKRINLKQLGLLSPEELASRITAHKQALCIVNTRKHAHELFALLPREGSFHLSTHMYPKHRSRVIKTIRETLAAGDTCRVVSTQLLEAGVDLDFPVGYREQAGLDSIIQAGGRVNREFRTSEADLFVFKYQSESAKGIPGEIRQQAAVADSIFQELSGKDLTSLEAVEAYYNLLYDVKGEQAFDREKIMSCFIKPKMKAAEFDFRTAAERFRLIDDNTLSIVVPLEEEVNTLLHSKSELSNRDLARKLQLYSVNIYENEYKTLSNLGAIGVEREVFIVLNQPEHYYDPQEGLRVPKVSGSDGIFIDI